MNVSGKFRNFRNPISLIVESNVASGGASFCLLTLCWVISQHLRNKDDLERVPDESVTRSSSGGFAMVEALKLIFLAVKYLLFRGKEPGRRRYHGREPQDLQAYTSVYHERQVNLDSPKTISRILISALAASLYAIQNYAVVAAEQLVDPITLYLAFAVATFFSLLALFSFLGKPLSDLHWQGALIQGCGLFIIQSAIRDTIYTTESIPALVLLVLSRPLALTLIDHLYDIYEPVTNTLYLYLFSSGLLIHISVYLAEYFLSFNISPSSHTSVTPSQELIQAGIDLASLAIIYDRDAVAEGLTRSFSAALFILYTGGFKDPKIILGCCVVGSGLFAYQGQSNGERKEKSHHRTRSLFGIFLFASAAIYAAYAALGQDSPRKAEVEAVPSVSSLLNPKPVCTRNPRPPSSIRDEDRVYHAFDNVLLIVFFSHARYDANLDFYRATYEEFFPNMVFVGPASREDKGFSHSYDVLVDSYQSDEDLNSDPNFYKMAGRMAHHMLYTAMKAHPCYDGYLWAPFDTLLNLPRLQQFDQTKVWYHSPFAQYVNNRMLGANHNATRHPPPASISPDPHGDYAEKWRGWGPDWWWGDPHVGLPVCMPAFEKVPLQMRHHLASLTNGTRLIGGSVDTAYIPGKYSQDFLDILGLFLETDCFLEIATPTALHLIVPPDDFMQFVDHWWIWESPFNATFVRQKWKEHFEVDTFHTFHWGEKVDGVFSANSGNIGDVRKLLVESSIRQGVDFPHLDWP